MAKDNDPAVAEPGAIAGSVSDTGVEKATLPVAAMIGLGLLAGVYIGFGGLLATLLGAGADAVPYGLGQVAAGVGFSLGLILVIVAGAELFTGNTLLFVPWAQRRIGAGQLARALAIVYAANLAGSLLLVLAAVGAGVHLAGEGAVAVSAVDTAAAKTRMSAGAIVASGILANLLVCLAVWMAAGARSAVDKVAVIVPPVAAFVALDLEHSVANMSLLPLGLLAQQAVDTAGMALPTVAGAAWNLLWSTLGNLIGGAALGLLYWSIYLRGKDG